jgi:hypothetical protein
MMISAIFEEKREVELSLTCATVLAVVSQRFIKNYIDCSTQRIEKSLIMRRFACFDKRLHHPHLSQIF